MRIVGASARYWCLSTSQHSRAASVFDSFSRSAMRAVISAPTRS